MATTNYDCESCETLRQDAPSLICNGLDDDMCTSLSNDTGLVPSSGNNDCEDLNNLNDCLIGNMEAETELYSTCDWKDFMKQFIPNLWTVLKAIICAICGIWTNIHNLWDKINEILNNLDKLQCILDYLSGSQNVSTRLNESAFVAGTGVSFNRTDDNIVKPNLIISGSTYTLSASIAVNLNESHWGNLGVSNSGSTVSNHTINTPDGNYTLCLIKIPKSVIPSVSSLISTEGQFVNAGTAHLFVQVIDGDSTSNTYAGQWGNASGRVTAEAGYLVIRVAVSSLVTWGIESGDSSANVTFRATGLAITNPDGISC